MFVFWLLFFWDFGNFACVSLPVSRLFFFFFFATLWVLSSMWILASMVMFWYSSLFAVFDRPRFLLQFGSISFLCLIWLNIVCLRLPRGFSDASFSLLSPFFFPFVFSILFTLIFHSLFCFVSWNPRASLNPEEFCFRLVFPVWVICPILSCALEAFPFLLSWVSLFVFPNFLSWWCFSFWRSSSPLTLEKTWSETGFRWASLLLLLI